MGKWSVRQTSKYFVFRNVFWPIALSAVCRFAVGLSDGSVQIWDQRKSVHQVAKGVDKTLDFMSFI